MVRFHPFSSSQTVSLPEGNHMEHVNLVFTESIQVLYLKPCGNTSGWIENPPNLGKMDAVFFLNLVCYPLVNVYITNWNITMLFMGKSTISTGPWLQVRKLSQITRG